MNPCGTMYARTALESVLGDIPPCSDNTPLERTLDPHSSRSATTQQHPIRLILYLLWVWSATFELESGYWYGDGADETVVELLDEVPVTGDET